MAAVVAGAGAVAATRALRAPTPSALESADGGGFSAGALEVELSGCAALRREPARGIVCDTPDDGVLRAWIRAPAETPLAFRTSAGDAAPLARVTTSGGALVTLKVAPTDRELRVDAGGGDPARRRAWSVALAQPAPAPVIDEANALRKKGDLAGAAARLTEVLPALDVTGRARATGLLARVALARGDLDAAFTHFREAIALDRVAARVSDEVDDALALAYALTIRSRRFSEARAVVAEAARASRAYPDGRARIPFYEGIIAMETGDLRRGRRLLADASDSAARLGLERLGFNARMAQGNGLIATGRRAEALAVFRALDATARAGRSPCELADLANNLGWALLALREVDPAATDPTPQLEAALALARGACAEPSRASFVLVNLAYAALQRGDAAAARAWLEQAKKSQPDPNGSLVVDWLELEGRAALLANQPRVALAAFEREKTLADASLSPDARWRATVGRADALEASDKVTAALDAYGAAEVMLEQRAISVPLGEGRDTFLGEHERSARQRIDLLLRVGRVDEALATARRARARLVFAVQQADRIGGLADADRARWEDAIGAYRRDRAALDAEAAGDWKLPADRLASVLEGRRAREAQLRASLDVAFAVLAGAGERPPERARLPPSDGSLVLAFHPVRAGWAVFAEDARGAEARVVATLDPRASADALASAILSPLRAKLARATRLRVLAYGALRDVDVHALPWDGAPLVERLAVEYPLDVGSPSARADERAAEKPVALVVSDPNGDLPAARREAKEVETLVASSGAFAVTALRGEAATRKAFGDALGRADLLHYAGHGVFAGRDGWESELPLAQGGRMTIGDILALPRAPSRVILSSCETARTSSDAPPEGLGLAHAFISAGAKSVVAPVRPVADALAAEMATALYRAMADARGGGDAASALRDAQRAVRAKTPDADWASYRVLVP